jgi:hypothetical protein
MTSNKDFTLLFRDGEVIFLESLTACGVKTIFQARIQSPQRILQLVFFSLQ